MRTNAACLTVMAFTLLAPRAARAIGPFEVAALAGGGTNPAVPPTFFGFGAGGRAGVSLARFYLGAAAVYYAGGSLEDGPKTESAHSFLVGGQGGYTFQLGVLSVRPVLEMGLAEITNDGTTAPFFYIQPGFTILVPIGPLFVGVDLNGVVVPSYVRPCGGVSDCVSPPTTQVVMTIHGQVGVRF